MTEPVSLVKKPNCCLVGEKSTKFYYQICIEKVRLGSKNVSVCTNKGARERVELSAVGIAERADKC